MFAVAAFMLGVTAFSTAPAFAADKPSDDREQALVTALAQKFNLNATDVQTVIRSVMEKQKTVHMAEQEQVFTDRINKAVADKKLTQDQATLLIAKAKEVKVFMESLTGKTETERKTAMKTQMDSLKQWLTDNNIPKDYSLFLGIGEREGMGKGQEKKQEIKKAVKKVRGIKNTTKPQKTTLPSSSQTQQ